MNHSVTNKIQFGLKEPELKKIIDILRQHPQVEEACIFGSRAKGNYKTGSDVDLALKGEKLIPKIITRISYLLNEETTMTYHFDVLNFQTLKNIALVEHIKRVGKTFFKK